MSEIRGMKFGSRNFKSFDKRSIESKLKEKKETNEGLALDILLNASGNEESMNQACDLIKVMGLVDDYY